MQRCPSTDLHVENMELLQCHIDSAVPFLGITLRFVWMLSTPKLDETEATREHLNITPLTLKGSKFTISPKQARDDYLMDTFVQHDFDVETLRVLNEC